MSTHRNRQRGLTLIEALVAVAVVGGLLAVALPSYGNYTRRSMAAEGLLLAQPTLLKVREEVTYTEHVPSSGDRARPGNPQRRYLSATVKSIERYNLGVVINYTRRLDPEGQKEYSLVIAGTLVNGSATWRCLSGPAASAALSAAAAGGVTVGEPLPSKWAPSGC